MHDPDLIIRTSGERRLSNYLLWQSAYSELVFRDELWPDFSREALEESLGRVLRATPAVRWPVARCRLHARRLVSVSLVAREARTSARAPSSRCP